MSTLNHLFDLPDQICYVPCGFCTTILLVSVPCSSLSTVVTVICGHCASLLSVNMKKFSFLPFNLLTSLSNEDELKEQLRPDVSAPKGLEMKNSYNVISSDNDQDHDHMINQGNRVINKPPEKRRRGPSAYNRFIREEIRRLKTENPRIAHKEAFSTAAKNWAHLPHVHCKDDGESSGLEEENGSWSCDAADQVNVESKGLHERKFPRHSMWAKTPFE
uniref:HMG box domain-containing protein n=1 Tax=Salix viminalis TaxID=40686 RepID=A0A6N2K9J5_SALVM